MTQDTDEDEKGKRCSGMLYNHSLSDGEIIPKNMPKSLQEHMICMGAL